MHTAVEHIVYDDSTPSEYEGDDASEHLEGGDDENHTRYASRRYLCRIDSKQRHDLTYYLGRKNCDTHRVNLCDVTVYEEGDTYTIIRRTIGAPLYDDKGNYSDEPIIDDYLPVKWCNLTPIMAYNKCLLLRTLFYNVPLSALLDLQRTIRHTRRKENRDAASK